MIKKGVIDNETPGEHAPPGVQPGEPLSKQAADTLEDHVVVRVTDTVRDQLVRDKPAR